MNEISWRRFVIFSEGGTLWLRPIKQLTKMRPARSEWIANLSMRNWFCISPWNESWFHFVTFQRSICSTVYIFFIHLYYCDDIDTHLISDKQFMFTEVVRRSITGPNPCLQHRLRLSLTLAVWIQTGPGLPIPCHGNGKFTYINGCFLW